MGRTAGPGRTDRAERMIHAPAARLFSCWRDPALLVHWLPPPGMAGRVERYDFRRGGPFRLVLAHEEIGFPGKHGDGTDVIAGEFVRIEEPAFLGFASRFAGADPAFAGVMEMDWEFLPYVDGHQLRREALFRPTEFPPEDQDCLVRVTARNVPPGVPADIHVAALGQSLAQLAALVE